MSKFLVIEKMPAGIPMSMMDSSEGEKMMKLGMSDLEYKVNLQKQGKIVGGGPFLDVGGVCYILEVSSVEEMGEIFWKSPMNMMMQREVHPLGTFQDTMDGFKEGM